MLAPVQVQRYVRQILIPEVGRAGQERWVESRLPVSGSGPALDAAMELVTAAGVAMAPAPVLAVGQSPVAPAQSPVAPAQSPVAPDPVLAALGNLLLSNTAFADRRIDCPECLTAFFAAPPAPPSDEQAVTAFAAGAAAAAEALLQLLDPERPPIAMAFTPTPRRVEVCRCS